jgi:hypothetical protein
MRGVSRWASRVTPLLAVFLVFVTGAWADEPPLGVSAQARISPPGGVSAQARISPPGGVSAQARISPPDGIAPPAPTPTAQARVNPPVGAQSRLQPPGGAPMTLGAMILMWLQSQLSIPHG